MHSPQLTQICLAEFRDRLNFYDTRLPDPRSLLDAEPRKQIPIRSRFSFGSAANGTYQALGRVTHNIRRQSGYGQ